MERICKCYCYAVLSNQASQALRQFCDLLCALIWVIIPHSSTKALWQIPAETPSSEAGKLGEKLPWILLTKYLLHTPQGWLTCRKILRRFTSPPNKIALRILSALKIHHPRPGLNPQTLDPMASKINTRPHRTTYVNITYNRYLTIWVRTPDSQNKMITFTVLVRDKVKLMDSPAMI
jgi:hypothetical protein